MSLYILTIVFFSAILSARAALKASGGRIYIGAALNPDYLSDAAYKAVAQQQLNCLTPENEMKWSSIEGNRGQVSYGAADRLVQFAQQNNMKIRGHTLIWHSQVPNWVNGLNKNDLHSAMTKHITDEVGHFKGKIYAWDVINEVFNEDGSMRDSVWHKNFGNNYIAEAFKIAHSVDPNAKLYINDYNVEGKNKKSDGLYNLVKDLKNQGVPIHGVGFQSHFVAGGVPSDLKTNLDRFAALGLDVAITELDIRMQLPSNKDRLQQQARDYASVVRACVSVPRCVGITFWGISDKHSWVPSVFPGNGDALPWDVNYHDKPAVEAMDAALKGH